MGRYDFVSPGAMGLGALEQELMQRAMMARQRMLDEQQNADRLAGIRQRDEQIGLQRAQEERIAAEDRRVADRQRMLDAQALEDREKAARKETNESGVRGMMADALTQGPLTPDSAKTIGIMGFRENMPVPGIVAEALKPPKDELAEYEAKKKIDARYRAPERDTEPLVAVIGPDGRPTYVPRSQAIGKTPASNREQGRPVISGDAGRIADLDTSLDDLDVLESEIAGMTGTGSAIGAALPNAITDITGLGAESKQRQAVIDRVKQVIGKALEGGVLRKEDEAKYAKILPVIGDEPSVAAAKLSGLRDALIQRRTTFIDSLADAGYDTSRYPADRPRKQGGGGKSDPNARVTVVAPNGQRGTIPASQLQDALAQGYKRAQ